MQGGDPKQLFSELYDAHIERIYRFIYVKVSSQEIAEDLTADAFARFWRSLQNSLHVENAQAYLYRIARNVIAEHYRTGKTDVVHTSVETYAELLEDEGRSIAELAADSIEFEKIFRVLHTIHSDYQDLIIWRYLEELSTKEIAQITHKSEESVRVGLHRALNSLKEKLALPEGKPQGPDRLPGQGLPGQQGPGPAGFTENGFGLKNKGLDYNSPKS